MLTTLDSWTRGTCSVCHRSRKIRRGRCLRCHPEEYRELVVAGVPPMSAKALVAIARRASSVEEAEKILNIVHPDLGWNIIVRPDRSLSVRSELYVWVRRVGWRKAT